MREAEDCEEVSKEEVAGASQVLDLLADINRRGTLFRVILSKVFFYILNTIHINLFLLRSCYSSATVGSRNSEGRVVSLSLQLT